MSCSSNKQHRKVIPWFKHLSHTLQGCTKCTGKELSTITGCWPTPVPWVPSTPLLYFWGFTTSPSSASKLVFHTITCRRKLTPLKFPIYIFAYRLFFSTLQRRISKSTRSFPRRAFPLIKLRMLFVNMPLNTDSLTEFSMDKWPLSAFFGSRTSLN